MKRFMYAVKVAVVSFALASIVFCGNAGAAMDVSLWLGGQYTDYSDYGKKIGEFNDIYDDGYPKVNLDLFGTGENMYGDVDGYMHDFRTAGVDMKMRVANKFSGDIQVQMFRRQLPFNLYDDFNAREMTASGGAGGKMLSHEALDSIYDYHYDRYSTESEFEMLLAEKIGFKMIAAHQMIVAKGHEQKAAVTHCFSCHAQTRSAEKSLTTHTAKVGAEVTPIKPLTVGYDFSYRKFKSGADDVSFYYDPAKHPVHGGAAGEFGSRVLFADTYAAVGVYPETEKIGSKVKFLASGEKHALNGSFSYSRTENDLNNLHNVVLGGTMKFSTVLSPKVKLYANGTVTKIHSSDLYYDMPPWREGQQGGGQDIFNYYRASSLDRLYGKGTVRADMMVSQRAKLSLKAGYEHTRRYDYPEFDSETATNKYFGEGKLRYRKGLKYSLSAAYRLEVTEDPFTNYKGLFELVGRELLKPIGDAPLVYYYQREYIKYQTITTLPTIKHDIDLRGSYMVNQKVRLNAGLKMSMDENDDYDEITVEHSSFRPNLGVTVMPDPRWSLVTGYTYNYNKSTGPITVAMFDG